MDGDRTVTRGTACPHSWRNAGHTGPVSCDLSAGAAGFPSRRLSQPRGAKPADVRSPAVSDLSGIHICLMGKTWPLFPKENRLEEGVHQHAHGPRAGYTSNSFSPSALQGLSPVSCHGHGGTEQCKSKEFGEGGFTRLQARHGVAYPAHPSPPAFSPTTQGFEITRGDTVRLVEGHVLARAGRAPADVPSTADWRIPTDTVGPSGRHGGHGTQRSLALSMSWPHAPPCRGTPLSGIALSLPCCDAASKIWGLGSSLVA